jgi:hypothetical protein
MLVHTILLSYLCCYKLCQKRKFWAAELILGLRTLCQVFLCKPMLYSRICTLEFGVVFLSNKLGNITNWFSECGIQLGGLVHYNMISMYVGNKGRYMDYRMMTTPMVTNMKKVMASDSKLVDPKIYKKLIGSLLYLVNTRPDICFVVNTLSQFMVDLRHMHWITMKHVLRYLIATMEYGLRYLGGVAGI